MYTSEMSRELTYGALRKVAFDDWRAATRSLKKVFQREFISMTLMADVFSSRQAQLLLLYIMYTELFRADCAPFKILYILFSF